MGTEKHIEDRGFNDILPGGLERDFIIPWKKSGDEVWDELNLKIEDDTSLSTVTVRSLWPWVLVAASLMVLLGIAGVMRFYKIELECLPGDHLSLVLPGGSEIELNADSQLSYFPYWWKISRHVNLEGEAFFKVKKGNSFKVISQRGETHVLGTSFNIISRDDQYLVECISGNVKVVSRENKSSVEIKHDQQAVLNKSGELRVEEKTESNNTFSLRKNSFIFTTAPLAGVLQEIEKQYHIVISVPESFDYSYTGNFNRFESVDQVLSLVCKPFGLIFVRESEDQYRIEKEQIEN